MIPGLTIVGVDPGVTGAIAIYFTDNIDRVATYDMPIVGSEVNSHELFNLLQKFKPDLAVIERVGPMPRDGVVQAWRFSAAYTTVKTVIALSGIPMTLISPSMWKKAVGISGGPKGKEQSRARALQLFPKCSFQFNRKKDAGRAEAALLAHHFANELTGRRHHELVRIRQL